MPKIGSFKTKTYRSWDNDLLSSLKIKYPPEETEEKTKPAKDFTTPKKDKQLEPSSEPVYKNEDSENNNNTSSRVQAGFKQGSMNTPQESKKDSRTIEQGSLNRSVGFKQGSSRVQDINKNIDVPPNNGYFQTINKLPRSEKLIFKYIIKVCQTNDCIETGLMSSTILDQIINSTKNTRETAIKRLIKRGLITRKKGNPRQGTINLAVTEEIKKDGVKYFIANSTEHLETKEFNSPYSSSNNTTTEMPKEWADVQFNELEKYGFNKNHICQIYKMGSIEVTDFQKSIDYFTFDLNENNKAAEIRKSPVEFFMGILRREGFYNAPKNYESPEDKALRVRVEQLEEQQERRRMNEERLIKLEFSIWKDSRTKDEIDGILPEEVKQSRFDAEREGYLRTYFKDNFWDEIKKEKHADIFK